MFFEFDYVDFRRKLDEFVMVSLIIHELYFFFLHVLGIFEWVVVKSLNLRAVHTLSTSSLLAMAVIIALEYMTVCMNFSFILLALENCQNGTGLGVLVVRLIPSLKVVMSKIMMVMIREIWVSCRNTDVIKICQY